MNCDFCTLEENEKINLPIGHANCMYCGDIIKVNQIFPCTYKGMVGDAHEFELNIRFSCPECNHPLKEFLFPCGDIGVIDVTEEFAIVREYQEIENGNV